MRSVRLVLFGLAIIGLGRASPSPAAVVDYLGYQAWGGAWSDAEKSPSNGEDDLMCWAASSSNVLQWTGWGAVLGMTTADQIFAYYQNHWTDLGGNPYVAWDWWFSGRNEMQGASGWSQVDVPGGNFFPSRNIDAFRRYSADSAAAMSIVNTDLHDEYGVTLTILTATGGANSITAWGVRYNDAVSGDYQGLWVTDSDDDKSSRSPPDTLRYYNVSYTGGAWHLQNYYGTSAWYIAEVVSLRSYGDGTPEPGSLAVWGIGIGLVASYRWQRRRAGRK